MNWNHAFEIDYFSQESYHETMHRFNAQTVKLQQIIFRKTSALWKAIVHEMLLTKVFNSEYVNSTCVPKYFNKNKNELLFIIVSSCVNFTVEKYMLHFMNIYHSHIYLSVPVFD